MENSSGPQRAGSVIQFPPKLGRVFTVTLAGGRKITYVAAAAISLAQAAENAVKRFPDHGVRSVKLSSAGAQP